MSTYRSYLPSNVFYHAPKFSKSAHTAPFYDLKIDLVSSI